ncbi:AAA family ATPase [Methylobacterium sp. A52T]
MTTPRAPSAPPTLRELLCGAALFGGTAHEDLYLFFSHTWPDVMCGNRHGLYNAVGCSWPMTELLFGVWDATARMMEERGKQTRVARRVFQTQLLVAFRLLRDMLDARLAEDIELDWAHGLPSPLDDLRGRLALILYMLGEASVLDELMRLLWSHARRSTPGDGYEELFAAALGASILDGSYRSRHIPGTDLIDVLAQWREEGREAFALVANLKRQAICGAVTEALTGEKTAPRPEPVAKVTEAREEPAASETEASPSVVVVPRIGGGGKGQSNKDAAAELQVILGARLPLYAFPSDRRVLVEGASVDAPHARLFFERLVALQDTREHWALPPILALGAPGGGKTTAVDAFFRRCGVHVERYACDGSSDSAAAGTPRRWLSGEVSLPLRAAMTAGHANPAVLWDEVNRAGGNRQGSGGTLRDALTSLLEPENARRYRDPFVEAEVDISHVLHVATANSLDGIASQVVDRFVVLEFPLPTREHLPVLARRMALEVARRQGLPDDHGELDRAEIQALSQHWPGGSLRSLKKLVEVAMQVRMSAPWATRH